MADNKQPLIGAGGESWSSGLCGCFEDLDSCCYVMFFPTCAFGTISEKAVDYRRLQADDQCQCCCCCFADNCCGECMALNLLLGFVPCCVPIGLPAIFVPCLLDVLLPLNCAAAIFLQNRRTEFRKRFEIDVLDGPCDNDALTMLFCPRCALCQQARHLKSRNLW